MLEGADGSVDDWAFAGDELEVQAHGSEREQEVGEDDGGVYAEALGGGDGDLRSDGRGAADVQQGVVLADGHVLRHVAAGLAEEPDRGAVYGLAEAGADKAGGGGEDGGGQRSVGLRVKGSTLGSDRFDGASEAAG